MLNPYVLFARSIDLHKSITKLKTILTAIFVRPVSIQKILTAKLERTNSHASITNTHRSTHPHKALTYNDDTDRPTHTHTDRETHTESQRHTTSPRQRLTH